jgi:hypothetical protein
MMIENSEKERENLLDLSCDYDLLDLSCDYDLMRILVTEIVETCLYTSYPCGHSAISYGNDVVFEKSAYAVIELDWITEHTLIFKH